MPGSNELKSQRELMRGQALTLVLTVNSHVLLSTSSLNMFKILMVNNEFHSFVERLLSTSMDSYPQFTARMEVGQQI